MGRDSNSGGGGNGKDKDDGVGVYPATPDDLRSYRDANALLGQMRVPQMIDSGNPHQRMFVAVMDGTGNDMFKDAAANQTGVARIYQDIRDRHAAGELPNVAAAYVTGPGTQEGWWAKTKDGAQGHTVDERAETMYKLFIERSADWLRRDPQAQISATSMGFSRGAEEVALFARLVHERGIQDPTGAKYTYDDNGLVKGVTYSKPPLVEPGQVAQAVMLHDPVGTGKALDMDRRLPPSVMSGLQVFSEDERRNLFKASNVLPRENGGNTLSEEGRFLNVTVGGAHSDIGGAYTRKGLGTLSENLARDYLNGLSDKPFLSRQVEPADPSQYVVHRSEQHQWFYRTSEFDKAGERQINANLAPNLPNIDRTIKQPIDETMSAGFTYRQIATFPIQGPAAAPEQQQGAQIVPLRPDFKGLSDAMQNGDRGAETRIVRDFQQSPAFEEMRQTGRQLNAPDAPGQTQTAPQPSAPPAQDTPQDVPGRSSGMGGR